LTGLVNSRESRNEKEDYRFYIRGREERVNY